MSATRAFGQIGFALLASPLSHSSYNDRINNAAISFNNDNYGAWYARYSTDGITPNNTASTGSFEIKGNQSIFKNFTFTLSLTAPDRMNAIVSDGSTTSNFYDLKLNNYNSITEYSVYLSNDWDGVANQNIYWSKS